MEKFNQPALFELSELYEIQRPHELLAMKALHLSRAEYHQMHVSTINDVITAYGAYDANDGTVGSPEHPEDSRWL